MDYSPQSGTSRLHVCRQAKLAHPSDKDALAASTSIFTLSNRGHALVGCQPSQLFYLLPHTRQFGLGGRGLVRFVMDYLLELGLTFEEDVEAPNGGYSCLRATRGTRRIRRAVRWPVGGRHRNLALVLPCFGHKELHMGGVACESDGRRACLTIARARRDEQDGLGKGEWKRARVGEESSRHNASPERPG